MKNTLKTLTGLAAVASISAMASFGAHAQSNQIEAKDSGFYVGGNYGYLRVEGEDDFDDDKDVWQGLVGYKFNEWIAIEGGYIDFGDYGNSQSSSNEIDNLVKTTVSKIEELAQLIQKIDG